MIDLGPAAGRLTELLAHIDDDQLEGATPCPAMTVGDLVDHVGSFAVAFTASAKKEPGRTGPAPTPDAANLGPDWRERIARDIDGLVVAWRDPAAWEGTASAGGGEFPAELTGLIALDELVVHGWDIATATGQPFLVSDDNLAMVSEFAENLQLPRTGAVFGPIVEVGGSASAVDRMIGFTGRDPGWARS
jgi:uncharacterized protein (TIGR03086 family)